MSGTSTVSMSGNAALEPPDKTLRKYTAGKEHTSKKIYSWEKVDGPKLKVKNMYGIYSWERENSPKLKIKTMYGIYCWEPDKTLRKYTAGKERVVQFFVVHTTF